MTAARIRLESLLRARKLDVTLTSAGPWKDAPAVELASTGLPFLDGLLGGGVRRGHLSEVVGRRSSGRTSVLCRMIAAATGRGELAALVDTHDRFDPASASAAGVDLTRVLWIRERGDASRALKAMNLILQAGGFGLVAFDLADVPGPALRGVPFTTWLRLARAVEGSQTVAVLVGSERIARSPGGVTIALESASASGVRWIGSSDRARLLHGLDLAPRVIAGR